MSTVKVNVKWNKQTFEGIELDQTQPPSEFKIQLFSLTGVEPERQKILVKGGSLKDDTKWETLKLKDGFTFMLMGTPGEETVNTEPKPEVKFIEDMTEAEIAQVVDVPPGLTNLGNTCYANATLQCLRTVPELRESLDKYQGQLSNLMNDPNGSVAIALRDLFKQLAFSANPVAPLTFILLLRRAFPQFDQQQNGQYLQQDAEECWGQIITSLSQKLKNGSNESLINQLFGIEYASTWTSEEDPEEPITHTVELQTKLQCYINLEVNYLQQGIKEGLTEKLEKRSQRLGRDARYTKVSKISHLPPNLTVNFVRFFWDKKANKKLKILRKVKFELELDLFEFCTDELKQQLQPARAILIGKDKPSEKGKEKEKQEGDTMQVDSQATSGKLGRTGIYELTAVLTHIGRSSNSGHYMAWVKKGRDEWLKYDDDKVSLVKDEDIMKLDGGSSDWHIAYLSLYRERAIPL